MLLCSHHRHVDTLFGVALSQSLYTCSSLHATGVGYNRLPNSTCLFHDTWPSKEGKLARSGCTSTQLQMEGRSCRIRAMCHVEASLCSL